MKKNIFLILYTYLLSIPALSFEFTPSVVSYSPTGNGATQKYSIYNSQGYSSSIEVSSKIRQIDGTGAENLLPTKDFNIYPRLFTLKPGESRTIKVTYIGEKNLIEERAYRIVAEQLSVDKEKPENKKGSNVALNFLFKYETSAYVTPDGAKPNVSISRFYEKMLDKKKLLYIEFENAGNAHQVFQNWKLEISQNNSSNNIKLSKNNVKNFPQFNLLARSKITISIPWPEKLESLPTKVTYQIDVE